jgi:hypothetical protein
MKVRVLRGAVLSTACRVELLLGSGGGEPGWWSVGSGFGTLLGPEESGPFVSPAGPGRGCWLLAVGCWLWCRVVGVGLVVLCLLSLVVCCVWAGGGWWVGC